MTPVTRRSERRTWASTGAWRVSCIVLATVCGVTSATPMSREPRSNDIVSAVGVASATVGRAPEVTGARLTAQGHSWALTERADDLAAASAAFLVADRETEAVTTAAAQRSSAAAADAWPNGAIPLGELCSPDVAPGILLRCDAAEALDRLALAYRAANGRELRVYSGYRTYERQAEIKHQHGALAAAPGRSNHGRGIAIDLLDMGGLGEFDAPGYLWMKAHAAAFGWYHPPVMEPGGRGPQEPWHWEFGTWSGYDDGGNGGAPRKFDHGPLARIRPDLPVGGPPVEQPPPPEASGAPGAVVPPIEASADPPTPPAAPTPPEPSTPPGETPPPTSQEPPQEAPPDGESPPPEESPPAEECSPADENVPAEDSPDTAVPPLAGQPLAEDAPVGNASADGRLSGSEGSPPGAQTPSTDGTGPPPPAEAGACEVERP